MPVSLNEVLSERNQESTRSLALKFYEYRLLFLQFSFLWKRVDSQRTWRNSPTIPMWISLSDWLRQGLCSPL